MAAWRARAGVVGVVLTAVSLRIGLVTLGWPQSNGDEGVLGLMALHIAQGRDFPALFYGASYDGAAQAYLGAALFRLGTPSLQALRLGMVLLHALFLIAAYRLGRRLYSPGIALTAIALLALGSRELLAVQVVSIGGLPETLLAGTMLLLVASWLAMDAQRASRRRRQMAYLAWGFAAGFGLWSDMLTLPFLAASAPLLLAPLRRKLVTWRPALAATLAGLLLGLAPTISANLTEFKHDPLSTFVGLYARGGSGQHDYRRPTTPPERIANATTISIAYATGGTGPAWHDPPALPNGWPDGWRPTHRHASVVGWSLGWLALLALATWRTLRALRNSPDGRLAGRAALLGAAWITLLAFSVSQAPGISPANSSRYLIGLLVATPALVHALWSHRLAALSVIAAMALVLGAGSASAYRDALRQDGEAAPRALIDDLLAHGVTRLYSDYWTCNRLTFLSTERLVCAVLDGDDLHTGTDAYLPYRRLVHADPTAAYVFHSGTGQANAIPMMRPCRWRAHWHHPTGYEVYQPLTCPPPRAETKDRMATAAR